MSEINIVKGFAPSGGAQLYYETAGAGQPFIMIHAGVADSRQWNNEFAHFAQSHRVIRYDQRGFGKSEPADGEFSHLGDLNALLNHLQIHEPLILMGCSMGGGLAINFTLSHPSRVSALILVDSGPPGLQLDVPASPKFEQVEKAFAAGNLDLVAELETQIWFDGEGRTPAQVNQDARKLLYEMNRLALAHEVKELGKRQPDTEVPAVERLSELKIPVLILVGEHDSPFTLAAADYMRERIPSARKVVIKDAAHLPNMDHPQEFRNILRAFLDEVRH